MLEKSTSAFKPYGYKVFNFSIQKSSRLFNRSVSSTLSMFTLLSCSIKVNPTCRLKSWFGCLKCWSAYGAISLFMSLRWIFSVTWSYVSDFPMYWMQRWYISLKYIKSLLLSSRSWKIWFPFLYDTVFEILCMENLFATQVSRSEETFCRKTNFVVLDFWFVFTFPFTIFLHSSNSSKSWRLLIQLKAKIGGSWKTGLWRSL